MGDGGASGEPSRVLPGCAGTAVHGGGAGGRREEPASAARVGGFVHAMVRGGARGIQTGGTSGCAAGAATVPGGDDAGVRILAGTGAGGTRDAEGGGIQG